MTDPGKALTERMTNIERDQSFPDSVPRDAATIMLIDRSGAEPMVLLGKRHANHKFMPGKFVFPGGRVEAADARMAAVSELHPDAQQKLAARPRDNDVPPPRAFALAVVRELFEETGLLLGRKSADPVAVPDDAWKGFADHAIVPDLGNLHFIARAITPPRRPKRFDSRFFTADAEGIAGKVEGLVGPDSELVELVWIPIREAARLDMPTITSVVLEELGLRVKAGMAPSLAVPFYHMVDDKFRRDEL